MSFLVMFGHTMITPNDYEDLDLLSRAINTVEQAAKRSKGLSKLLEACRNLHRIASAKYASQSHPAALEQPISSTNPATVQQRPQSFKIEECDPIQPAPEFNFADFGMDWDQNMDGWEFGLGADNAKEMSSFFGQYHSNVSA